MKDYNSKHDDIFQLKKQRISNKIKQLQVCQALESLKSLDWLWLIKINILLSREMR